MHLQNYGSAVSTFLSFPLHWGPPGRTGSCQQQNRVLLSMQCSTSTDPFLSALSSAFVMALARRTVDSECVEGAVDVIDCCISRLSSTLGSCGKITLSQSEAAVWPVSGEGFVIPVCRTTSGLPLAPFLSHVGLLFLHSAAKESMQLSDQGVGVWLTFRPVTQTTSPGLTKTPW